MPVRQRERRDIGHPGNPVCEILVHLARGHELLELLRCVDADLAHVPDQAKLHCVDRLKQPIIVLGEHQGVVAHFAHGVVDHGPAGGEGEPGHGGGQDEADEEATGYQQVPGARPAETRQELGEARRHKAHSIRYRLICRKPLYFGLTALEGLVDGDKPRGPSAWGAASAGPDAVV